MGRWNAKIVIGKLFTIDFLREGITATPAWKAISARAIDDFRNAVNKALGPFLGNPNHNEAVTESKVILPVLAALGWTESLPQQTSAKRGRTDVPDILLFGSESEATAALSETTDAQRFRHGMLVVESKRWQRPLDRGEATDPLDAGTPSNQMLRYLSSIETASNE